MELFSITLLALLGMQVTTAADWSYRGDNGPSHWGGICTTGKRQSPIDIGSENAERTDLGSLKFVRYDFAFHGAITNTGHSVQIQLYGVPIHLEGGSLPATYVLEQMHFHWSAEHTVDGVRDPLELHFVHHDIQYENVSVASQFENGIAVVAVLFELDKQDNVYLNPVLEATKAVSYWVGMNTAAIKSKMIPYLFLPKDHTTYYRYQGSLTTPGCQESVLWFVLTEKLTVSEPQLDIFKRVGTLNGTLEHNNRPTQDLSGRKVYHHLDGYSTAASLSSSLGCMFLSIFLVRLLQPNEV
ncbi:hypothetical protein KM043_016647 [Ampulex compressa]|nr:hypothetical protein KM043_016647 [Ampulex compressa]